MSFKENGPAGEAPATKAPSPRRFSRNTWGGRLLSQYKVLLAVAVLLIGANVYEPIQRFLAGPGNVVARVNGEPIYSATVNYGLPSDAFDSTTNDMRESKLARLITQTAIKQFLSQHRVQVPDRLVDEKIHEMEVNPPSLGCPCCTYPSLDKYLSTIGDSRDDLRLEIRNKLGLAQYARDAWRKEHPTTQSAMKALQAEGKTVRVRYVKAWQIFFNTFQKVDYQTNPRAVKQIQGRLAAAAWERLQRGESFAAVAASVSEDMTSKRKGGYLGPTDRLAYGREFAVAIDSLKPDQYGKPFLSSWGYHIIKWEPMSDDDVVKFCESDVADEEAQKVLTEIMKAAKVQRLKWTPDR